MLHSVALAFDWWLCDPHSRCYWWYHPVGNGTGCVTFNMKKKRIIIVSPYRKKWVASCCMDDSLNRGKKIIREEFMWYIYLEVDNLWYKETNILRILGSGRKNSLNKICHPFGKPSKVSCLVMIMQNWLRYKRIIITIIIITISNLRCGSIWVSWRAD